MIVLELGDIVMCIREVKFIDGTIHTQGQLIEVTQWNLDYFECFIGSQYQFVRKKNEH